MTSRLSYEQPERASPGDVRTALAAEDHHAASRAMIGSALYYEDWRDVQALCLELLQHADRALAATAATCLGHLARVHGMIDLDVVLPALAQYQDEELVGPRVLDAIEDIQTYVRRAASDADA